MRQGASLLGLAAAWICLALVPLRAQAGSQPGGATAKSQPTAIAAAGSKQPEAAALGASAFTPLDLPDWIVIDPKAASKTLPWVLVVDDPQCPYCMQLHLALEKAKEEGDTEIGRAVVVRLPFPLAYHDQSAHIVMDALCLDASGEGRLWTAASYLDWLIVDPWKRESGWKTATLEDLERDGGFFDSKYESHKVTSSRRRDFQTERARLESACLPSSCAEEPECEKLCAVQKACGDACPPAGAGAPGTGAPGGASEKDTPPPSGRESCLADCANRFVSSRYRQFSKSHSACLLENGARSAHARTAAAFDWAIAHKVPGTPTVYVGHPTIGFRTLGDSDHLGELFVLLKQGLSEARTGMAAVAAPH